MTETSLAELDRSLARAHAEGNDAALARLYERLARRLEADGDADAACYFMTHAYVLALAAGSPAAEAIRRYLVERGREAGDYRQA